MWYLLLELISGVSAKKSKELSFNNLVSKYLEYHAQNENQKLKNLLKRRESNLAGRINDLNNYLQALNNVVLLISTEYKKLEG